MDKPRWKYFTVARQDTGREMGNPDYIEWQEEKIKKLEAELLELEKKYADAYFSKDTYKQLESEIAVLNESISEYDKAVNSLEAENQRLTEAIEFEINQPMQIARQQERLQKALEGL